MSHQIHELSLGNTDDKGYYHYWIGFKLYAFESNNGSTALFFQISAGLSSTMSVVTDTIRLQAKESSDIF